jgi:acyl-CoA synthetase (AMP-forming)/AMP-acid ligase II
MLAAQPPDAPAVLDRGTVWSMAELAARGAAAANVLDEAGAAPGAAVPALFTTSPVALAFLLGGARTGRPIAPLGPKLTPRELSACVTKLRSDLIVTEEAFINVAAEVAERTQARLVVVPELEPSRRRLDMNAHPDDLAFVLHTSGTSGIPKAVPVREDRLATRTVANAALVELGPRCVYASASTFHHIAGLGMFAVALGAGAAVHCFRAFTVEGWLALGDAGVTHALLVPTMIEQLLAEGQLRIPSLRLLQYGASPIHPDTLRRTIEAVPGVRLLQIYGQTEGSPIAVLTPADHIVAAAGRSDLLATVGRAGPGVELRVESLDATGVGEVSARAAHLFRSDADGWLHTGDLGRIDREGYLHLSGRKGDMIIRGGENVHPLEVEAILKDHPLVAEAAVVGVPDQRWGQVVKAFIVPTDPNLPPEPEALRSYARSELAGYKVPTAWEIVDALPRSPQGKVLRRLLVSAH